MLKPLCVGLRSSLGTDNMLNPGLASWVLEYYCQLQLHRMWGFISGAIHFKNPLRFSERTKGFQLFLASTLNIKKGALCPSLIALLSPAWKKSEWNLLSPISIRRHVNLSLLISSYPRFRLLPTQLFGNSDAKMRDFLDFHPRFFVIFELLRQRLNWRHFAGRHLMSCGAW